MKLFAKRVRRTKRLRRPILLPYYTPMALLPMSIEIAQLTEVVSAPNFLSDCERLNLLNYMKHCGLPAYTSNVTEDISESGYPIHTTTYLQTNNIFEAELGWLYLRIRKLAKDVNASQWWGFNIGDSCSFNVRVAEYHEMYKGESLRNNKHYDCGSLITVDIMLHEANEGAQLQTLELIDGEEKLKQHPFRNGDALVFVSHKYHCVSPLIEGIRRVLVVEFWNGKKRCCGHRCDIPFEVCTFVDR